MRRFIVFVVLATGCGSESAAGPSDEMSRTQTELGSKPAPHLCMPDVPYCVGNEIRQCTAHGMEGPLIYDCATDPYAFAGNPIVCSSNGGYAYNNFVDETDYAPPSSVGGGPAYGCEHQFAMCRTTFDQTELNSTAYGTSEQLPNCGFSPDGTIFTGNIEVPPYTGEDDNLHIRLESPGGFITGQVITLAAMTNLDWTSGQVNGRCRGLLNESLWAFSGTATIVSLPPDFAVTVDMTCTSDPSIRATGTFSGRGPPL